MTKRPARAGRRSSSTPTATASSTIMSGLKDPVDPKKDKHVQVGFYGASPSPADGTVWASYLGFPGGDRALRSQDQADRVL